MFLITGIINNVLYLIVIIFIIIIFIGLKADFIDKAVLSLKHLWLPLTCTKHETCKVRLSASTPFCPALDFTTTTAFDNFKQSIWYKSTPSEIGVWIHIFASYLRPSKISWFYLWRIWFKCVPPDFHLQVSTCNILSK